MPWITRTKKKHQCKTPPPQLETPGDEWYCWRCRRVWRVDAYSTTGVSYWVKTTKTYNGG